MQDVVEERVAPLKRRLLEHPLYDAVDSLERLRVFARSHVFAVWDFMSLLKRLQSDLTCVEIPWRGRTNGELVRFVNEIVLAEESDEDGRGGYASHFELYLDAMREIGADTAPIAGFLTELEADRSAETALAGVPVLPTTREFVLGNLDLATNGGAHEVAATFCHGREDVIPDMFERLIATLRTHGHPCERLLHYLERHVALDGDTHGPIALRMVEQLCGGDSRRIEEAAAAAELAIRARIALWDGILDEIGETSLACSA